MAATDRLKKITALCQAIYSMARAGVEMFRKAKSSNVLLDTEQTGILITLLSAHREPDRLAPSVRLFRTLAL